MTEAHLRHGMDELIGAKVWLRHLSVSHGNVRNRVGARDDVCMVLLWLQRRYDRARSDGSISTITAFGCVVVLEVMTALRGCDRVLRVVFDRRSDAMTELGGHGGCIAVSTRAPCSSRTEGR